MSSEKPPLTSPRPVVATGSAAEVREHKDDIFFAAIELTRMPMLVTDPRQPDNPIIFVNRAFVAMSGYTEQEILGTNCRFLQGADTDRATVAAIREAIEARREISTEILNYRKDGSSFWNALFISPVFNRAGELVYYFASQLDVSRRRDAEDALAQAQKMEALGQLTGGISHDFNNLLQLMSSQLDVLRLKAQRGHLDAAAMEGGLQSLRGAVRKATTLTQQLLAFSRKQELRGRVINLNHTARAMEDMVARTLGESVHVDYTLAADLPNCELDSTQLEVAVLNLLVNARDAMPNGGRIHVETRAVHVGEEDKAAFAGLAPGDYACLALTDTGTGIAPDLLPRVMDPFFTTKDEGKGTGLGLSMVYGFARQSGGAATIYSEPGEGTCVRLYFPASSAVVSPRPRPVPSTTLRGGDETILVVDDRVEVAELATEMLSGLGYRVLAAHNGADALALARAQPEGEAPDLVFTDVVMPGGMNGYVLAQELRKAFPSIQVLLTSGFDRLHEQRGSHAAGDLEMLPKPYRMEDLARRVRLMLDGPTGSGHSSAHPNVSNV